MNRGDSDSRMRAAYKVALRAARQAVDNQGAKGGPSLLLQKRRRRVLGSPGPGQAYVSSSATFPQSVDLFNTMVALCESKEDPNLHHFPVRDTSELASTRWLQQQQQQYPSIPLSSERLGDTFHLTHGDPSGRVSHPLVHPRRRGAQAMQRLPNPGVLDCVDHKGLRLAPAAAAAETRRAESSMATSAPALYKTEIGRALMRRPTARISPSQGLGIGREQLRELDTSDCKDLSSRYKLDLPGKKPLPPKEYSLHGVQEKALINAALCKDPLRYATQDSTREASADFADVDSSVDTYSFPYRSFEHTSRSQLPKVVRNHKLEQDKLEDSADRNKGGDMVSEGKAHREPKPEIESMIKAAQVEDTEGDNRKESQKAAVGSTPQGSLQEDISVAPTSKNKPHRSRSNSKAPPLGSLQKKAPSAKLQSRKAKLNAETITKDIGNDDSSAAMHMLLHQNPWDNRRMPQVPSQVQMAVRRGSKVVSRQALSRLLETSEEPWDPGMYWEEESLDGNYDYHGAISFPTDHPARDEIRDILP